MRVDYSHYCGQMVRYYDNPSNDARKTHEARWARHYRREYEKPDGWLREVAVSLQNAVRGRNVLELACGHCRWTPFMAEVAETVLAVDLAPNMLQWGQTVFAYAAPDAKNVSFRLADAYRPDEIEGEFNAGAVINFFQHVPAARQDEFLILLHGKLGSGAKVFLAANHIPKKIREQLVQHDGAPDLYSRRNRPDGTSYEIIDNVFDEPGLRMLFGPHVKNFRYTSGKEYWWVEYEVP